MMKNGEHICGCKPIYVLCGLALKKPEWVLWSSMHPTDKVGQIWKKGQVKIELNTREKSTVRAKKPRTTNA